VGNGTGVAGTVEAPPEGIGVPYARARRARAALTSAWGAAGAIGGRTGNAAKTTSASAAKAAAQLAEQERARTEALRILVPGGWAALMWNDREVTGDAFAEGYEALCHRFGRDYDTIRTRHVDPEALAEFFGRVPAMAEFAHVRRLDFETMAALAASASYLPAPGTTGHEPLMKALRGLFDACSSDGMIALRYRLRVHCAPLA